MWETTKGTKAEILKDVVKEILKYLDLMNKIVTQNQNNIIPVEKITKLSEVWLKNA